MRGGISGFARVKGAILIDVNTCLISLAGKYKIFFILLLQCDSVIKTWDWKRWKPETSDTVEVWDQLIVHVFRKQGGIVG